MSDLFNGWPEDGEPGQPLPEGDLVERERVMVPGYYERKRIQRTETARIGIKLCLALVIAGLLATVVLYAVQDAALVL
jgi:hypothetical protein